MRAYVTFEVEGVQHRLGPGDIIGRAWTNALPLADPFISEAHALVSLREGTLKLLSLRGRLAVGGKNVAEVVLSDRLLISLSRRTELRVVEARTPSHLLALDLPRLGLRLLSGVSSLVTRPQLDLVTGANPAAALILWSDGLAWYARRQEGGDERLEPGQRIDVDGWSIPVTSVAVGGTSGTTTIDPQALDQPLVIIVRYDSVHISQAGGTTCVIDGCGPHPLRPCGRGRADGLAAPRA